MISFNSHHSQPNQAPRATLRRDESNTRDTASQVLHLQDPDCRTTSVRWGFLGRDAEAISRDALGIELEYLHLQVKNLGHNFYFEVAIQDDRRQVFVVRCSTFQVSVFLSNACPASRDHADMP